MPLLKNTLSSPGLPEPPGLRKVNKSTFRSLKKATYSSFYGTFSSLLLYLLLFCSLNCYAKGLKEDLSTELLEIEKENWNIGISLFKPVNLSQENHFLLYSLPLMLREGLEEIDIHQFSEEEIERYKERSFQLKLLSFIEQIEVLQKANNDLLLEEKTRLEIRKQKKINNKEIEQLRQEMEEFKEIGMEIFNFPEESTITLLPEIGADSSESEITSLLDPFKYSAGEYAREKGLDLYIWGEIEEIEGYFYVTIGAFNTILNQEVFRYEFGSSPDLISMKIAEIDSEIAEIILGRPWCHLTIIPVPEVSFVEINGELDGIGKISKRYYTPGPVNIRVYLEGYESQEESYVLSAFEDKVVTFDLVKEEEKMFFINTVPEEADVYLDSIWVGKTPLELMFPYDAKKMTIRKEDYCTVEINLSEITEYDVTYTLKLDNVDRYYWFERKRDKFYTAFGLWALSVPIPFLLNTFINDLNSREDKDRSTKRKINILTYTRGAAIFVLVSLSLNAIIRLIDYVSYSKNLSSF